jgi:hypothetical protein
MKTKTTQTKKRKTSAAWSFLVRSYRIVAEFNKASLPASQPSLTVIDLSSETGGPTAGQPNAVAYFYWPGKKLPARASTVHNNTLELHYPLAAFGGIVQMLQGSTDVYCYYENDPNDASGPRAGLEQKNFHVGQ